MRLRPLIVTFAFALSAHAQQTFTLQQVLSAPYANQLTAAPAGNLFAWVEDAEGRHNLYIGGPDTPARALTHNTEDDAQEITQLAWSPDASAIAYTHGATTGADGKPANPAHLQQPTPVQIIVQPIAPKAKPIIIGEGRSPLFTRDGKYLLYTHDGQIWIACIRDCHPEQSAKREVQGPASRSEQAPTPPHQLVYDRGSATSLTLSPDGTTLAFISRRRETNEPSHSFLALYDLTTHTLTFPAPSTSNDSAPTFSPDGKQLAWLRSPFTDTPEFANPRTSATPWSIQLLDLTTTPTATRTPTDVSSRPESPRSGDVAERPAFGTAATARTLYTPEPNKPGSVLPNMASGGPPLFFNAFNRLVFASEADGWVHLYYLDPATNEPPQSVRSGDYYEAESPTMSADGRRIVFTSNSSAFQAIGMHAAQVNMGPNGLNSEAILESDCCHFVNQPETITVLGKPVQTIFPPVCCHFLAQPQIAADGTLAALKSDVEHPMSPAIYRKDNDGAKFVPLHPGWPDSYPAAALVVPKEVLFDSSDGLHLHSQLFLPRRNADSSTALQNDNGERVTKHPAILFLHGGPKRQMLLGYPEMEYYSNAYAMNQYLTSRGFIVLSLNYRCGIGYGLEFRTCQQAGATGATEYNDVLAAQKYLASRPDVDPARIGIWGGSYGGYLTALALSRNSDLFAAGVDFHGVHDWNLEDNASDWKRGSFAQQDAIAAKALASSPMGDISHWKSPILLIHGDNDPDVAYAQTPLLADALRARNASLPKAQQVDIEELIFPDELHSFVLHKDWLAAYMAAAAFFERTLKP